MNAVSQAVMAKLGHRKQWIYRAVEAAGTGPTGKEKKKDPFAWSSCFWKLDLSLLGEPGKLIFSPAHYLEQRWEADTTLTSLYHKNSEDRDKLLKDYYLSESVRELFKCWLDRFQPTLEKKIPVATVETFADENLFTKLSEANASG